MPKKAKPEIEKILLSERTRCTIEDVLAAEKVPFSKITVGDFFLDDVGSLCIKISHAYAIELGEENAWSARVAVANNELVILVHDVSIRYYV